MEKIIKNLYSLDRHLLGDGYDKALEYINKIIPLEILEFKTGTDIGGWIIPPEWVVKDAWVKYKGKKIIDYKNNPLVLMDYSEPIHGICQLEELKKHLFISDEMPDELSYEHSFYEPNWGFSIPKNYALKEKTSVWKKLFDLCKECKDFEGEKIKVKVLGAKEKEEKIEYIDKLPKGEYEVFIDTEKKQGTLKIGVHTIKGKTDREILLFAHLDHPYQANDNLSGVACLIDLTKQLENKFEHTIKIIFCPETIGSIAYAFSQDILKVDFVIAVDAVGNDNTLLIQKAYNKYDRINYAVHLAVQELGVSYRKGDFRLLIGSDESVFNDSLIGISGIMLSRYPYKEYHTSADKPEIIKKDKLKETQEVILKTIEIYEKDFIPQRKLRGMLMRSRYGLQTPHKYLNRDLDYLWADIDGKKWLSEIVIGLGCTFDYASKFLSKLKDENIVFDISQIRQ